MKYMKLFERIECLLSEKGMSRKQLAVALDVPQNTFNRYFCQEQQDKLVPYLWKIFDLYSDVSREWLFFGEGEMLKTAPKRRVQNNTGDLTGDLLWVALNFARVTPEEAAKRCGLSEATLGEILDSRRYPTFEELEKLYNHLGIEPAYFLDGNEGRMIREVDPLLQVYWAIGKQGLEPQAVAVSEVFGVSLEEAKLFMAEWREFRKQGRTRVLPLLWYTMLNERYMMASAWLRTGRPPVLVPRDTQQESDKVAVLRQRIAELETVNADLNTALAALKEVVVRYKQEEERDRERPENPLAVSGTGVVL